MSLDDIVDDFVAPVWLKWLVLACVLVGLYIWAYNNGVTHERLAWQTRETSELIKANKTILDLTEDARAKESLHQIQLSAIDHKTQEDIQNAKANAAAYIKRQLTGAERVHVPVTAVSTCAGKAGETVTSLGKLDDSATAELHPAFSAALTELLGEADELAIQITGLQAVVIEDRRLCGVTEQKDLSE